MEETYIDEELQFLLDQRKVKPNPLANTKIIAVSSCKGGVGKSTTAVNIALSVSKQGYKTGILDADIYGPSIPLLLGLKKEHVKTEGSDFIPLEVYDIQAMSIGFIVDEDQPIAWRGPMLDASLHQLMYNTKWNELDYLIVDMPPGTGDIQLSISNKMNLNGVVIITTPQEISLLDVQKGIKLYQDSNIPIIGIVENMSIYICPNCGHESHIFGEGAAKTLLKKYKTKLLGSIPLNPIIRENADNGIPIVLAEPNSEITKIYNKIAKKVK